MFGLRENKKLSTESYKGVRDFYPEDQAIQNYIFKIMRQTAESWGYVEYNASILEPSELYKSKTSEEIVNEQTYTFKDRGDREVTLRPEMTPTVARMVAGKLNEIPLPARWYSIPNVFRYEKPQKGRLREHYQLNIDLFGGESSYADTEVIEVAVEIMKKFGAKSEDFEIQINDRHLMNEIYQKVEVPEDKRQAVSRIIDKKDKISKDDFLSTLKTEIGEKTEDLNRLIESGDRVFEGLGGSEGVKKLQEIIEILWKQDVKNVVFKPTLTRGFDYYTGMIFEVFDTNIENSRSLFGGGRYDNLLSAFSKAKVPAVGFGMGDVTMLDFLQTHNLLPQLNSTTEVWVCLTPETDLSEVYKLVGELRNKNINVGVDISLRKLGDQIISAEKRRIPLILLIGPDEFKSGNFKVRRLSDKVEKSTDKDGLVNSIKELLNA